MTLAAALGRAKDAVTPIYGTGHDGLIRVAVQAALNDDQAPVKPPVSGWAGIRDEPQVTVTTSHENELAKTILDTFKPRKTGGGYTAYVNDKTMHEWQETAGGTE